MTYAIRLRNTPEQFLSTRGEWRPQADRAKYPVRAYAEESAKRYATQLHEPVEVVFPQDAEGWPAWKVITVVWPNNYTSDSNIDRRITEAVAKVKAEFQAQRDAFEKKLKEFTWVGGPCPDYYKCFVRGVALMPFDVIEALGLNFNLGCVIKYVWRAGKKSDKLTDLKKAKNCLEREIARLEEEAPQKVVPSVSSTQFVPISPVSVGF